MLSLVSLSQVSPAGFLQGAQRLQRFDVKSLSVSDAAQVAIVRTLSRLNYLPGDVDPVTAVNYLRVRF